MGIGLKPPGALGDRHSRGMHADRAGQPGDPNQSLEPDADREPGIVAAEALLDAQLLGVVRPAFHERRGVEGAADLGGGPADGPPVREVPGRDLVHGDAGQRGRAEHLEPLLPVLLGPRVLGWGDVIPGRALGLARGGGGHHRHGPAPRRRGRPDPALAVLVGHQVAVPGKRDRELRPVPCRRDDAVGIWMIADKLACDLQRRAARVHARAAFGEQGGEPVHLGIGPLGQSAEIKRHPLGAAHERGEPRGAQRRVGIAVGGRLVDERHQPGVRRHRVRPGALVGGRWNAPRQPADPAGQGCRDRRAEPVERGDGYVDGLGPRGEVRVAGAVALLLRGILTVVAGEVEPGHMLHRVAAVHLQVFE